MKQWRRKHRVPTSGHPAFIRLFEEINAQMIAADDVARRAGLGFHTIWDWRDRRVPSVTNLEAALNVLGLTLTVSKKASVD